MAFSLGKGLVTVAVFAYGLFTIVLYGAIATKTGLFFRKRTEKESLELHLGMCLQIHYLLLPSCSRLLDPLGYSWWKANSRMILTPDVYSA